ncbi:MAG TPA: hypothetical protein VM223_11270 [Planctomycetota bacterium]|nr:hypothetical protein [Planctomycetota bacterium]
MTRKHALRLLAAVVGSIGAALGQEWAWVQEIGGGKEVFGLRLDRFAHFEVHLGDKVEIVSAEEIWDALVGRDDPR